MIEPARPDGATRLVLVRHTESEELPGVIPGATDPDLSAAGRDHARRLARLLADDQVVAVHASPRRRARATAQLIGGGMPVQTIDDLRELDFGVLAGRSYDDVRVAHPELYARWMVWPTRVRFPGGETHGEMTARALAAVDGLRRHRPGATTVVVTHGGVCRAVLAHTLGMRDEDAFHLDQRLGAVNVVDYFAETPLVRLLNG